MWSFFGLRCRISSSLFHTLRKHTLGRCKRTLPFSCWKASTPLLQRYLSPPMPIRNSPGLSTLKPHTCSFSFWASYISRWASEHVLQESLGTFAEQNLVLTKKAQCPGKASAAFGSSETCFSGCRLNAEAPRLTLPKPTMESRKGTL